MKQNLAPRHLQLRELLLHRWRADGVQIGDRIESQNEIARICDFSLITIVKTLKDLEADGIIRRQVGKGSFLVRTPWTEAHHRVGLFYNRDVVGGGIFNNDFYTRLVVELERAVVSDGHEFILGSFTNTKMPMAIWEALDVVLLTSITGETDLDFLDTAATQIGVIDQTLVHPRVHSYRLDYEDAFAEMFRHHAKPGLRVLYLDSEIASSEQSLRREALNRAMQTLGDDAVLEVLKVNQETVTPELGELLAAAEAFRPDIVLGYLHTSWQAPLAEHLPGDVRIYPYGLDRTAPGFVLRTDDWMQAILPRVYGNLTDRRTPGAVHAFPVRFEI